MRARVVLTTVGDEEAGSALARELVERRLAACVNLIPGIRSFYRWQGEICRDAECLLVIKTTDDTLEALTAAIHELHRYELPEVLALEASEVEPRYLAWIAGSVGGPE